MPNFELTIFNALLYVLLLIVHFKKRKFTVGNVILAMYACVACFCVATVYNDPNNWKLTLWPFLYLFLCVYLLAKPFLIKPTFNICLKQSSYLFYKKIATLYICISLFSCIVYLPIAYDHIINPEWADLYKESHQEKDSNMFVKFSNLFFHVRYLGIVLFFYFIAFGAKRWFLIIMGICAILPVMLVTICNASRGGLVALVASILFSYLLFADYISQKIKRYLKLLTIFLVPLCVIYFAAVTISRFDPSISYVSPIDSIIDYLGHSMLTFNYGVVDTIQSFWYGSYMFGLGELNDNGTHYGSAFFTLVGAFYQDFGPIFTLIISMIISGYFCNLLRKRSIGVPELFVLLTYAMLVFNGVFVVGYGFGVQFVEALIIYYVLKNLEFKRL